MKYCGFFYFTVTKIIMLESGILNYDQINDQTNFYSGLVHHKNYSGSVNFCMLICASKICIFDVFHNVHHLINNKCTRLLNIHMEVCSQFRIFFHRMKLYHLKKLL